MLYTSVMESITVLPDQSEILHYENPAFPLFLIRSALSNYSEKRVLCHWHKEMEFFYVEKGRPAYFVNGNIVQLNEGDIIFINSKTLHYGFSPDGEDSVYVCLVFMVSSEPPIIIGLAKSATDSMKVTKKALVMPGASSGSVISLNTFQREAPISRAASSSEGSTFFSKPESMAAFAPIDDEHTMIYIRFYQNVLPTPILGGMMVHLGNVADRVILHQDRRVVLTQLPKKSELQMNENLIQGDAPIIAYRLKRDALKKANPDS